MAAIPYLQFYPADYLADTAHLTTEEHGAYLLLIFNYWQRGKPLPSDPVRLARIARMTSERWTDVEQTLSEYFNVEGETWVHSRIEHDLSEVSRKTELARKAGKASAEARKRSARKSRLAKAASECSTDVGTDVKRMSNHTDTDTDTDTEHTVLSNSNSDKGKSEKPVSTRARTIQQDLSDYSWSE